MSRRRTRSRSRLLTLVVGGTLLGWMGVAHLAVNTVPPTSAGLTSQAISLATATALSLDDAKVNVAHDGRYQFLGMKATLTQAGQPISGAVVTFAVAGTTVCTETTKHNGQAICPSNGTFDRSLFAPVGADPTTYPYTATFAGSGVHRPSTATGTLTTTVGSDSDTRSDTGNDDDD